MIIAARTHRGNVREKNEDCMLAQDDLMIVADGMGGHMGGEVASAMAVEAVKDAILGKGVAAVNAGDIDAAMQEANRRVFEAADKSEALQGMGTTMTMCLIKQNVAVVAHIGDSRAYLMRNGRLTRLTRDHSLVEELVRSGYITREQAAIHPHRHVITRVLGTEGLVRVDQRRVAVQKGDRILLCTDGIMLHIPDEEIERMLREEGDVQEQADALLSLALERGGEDNITVVCASVEGGGAL